MTTSETSCAAAGQAISSGSAQSAALTPCLNDMPRDPFVSLPANSRQEGIVPELSRSRPLALHSAGILLFRRISGRIEVLLIHPGGPFWRQRDEGAWMMLKGMDEPGEEPAAAARREFEVEVGTRLEG